MNICRTDPDLLESFYGAYSFANTLAKSRKKPTAEEIRSAEKIEMTLVMIEAFKICYLLDQNRIKAMKLASTPDLDAMLTESYAAIQKLTKDYKGIGFWDYAVARSQELGDAEYFENFSFENLYFNHK